MFKREDWMLFRTLDTLGHKAGVSLDRLPALVAKELADNALDAGATCRVLWLDGNGLRVEDDGEGIPGDDLVVADLFSIARPLTSSKLLRLPTRGALGNGLRVVAGAVLASGGSLEVGTRGRTLRLTPREDGTTAAEVLGAFDQFGTRVDLRLGPALRVGPETLRWANRAIALSGGKAYQGKPSPHWYDSDAFLELLRAAGGRTVRQVVAEFDGCTEPKAGRLAGEFKGRLARDLDRGEADRLLSRAREATGIVRPHRLGCVGPAVRGMPAAYAKVLGMFKRGAARGTLHAELPFVLEAWAEVADRASAEVSVNRTPVTAKVEAYHDPKERTFDLFGCGLAWGFPAGRCPLRVRLNVDTPYMPITSDGKSPDLGPLFDSIDNLMAKVIRKAKARGAGMAASTTRSQKDIILGSLNEAIAKAGADGAYRFSLRQLFYAVRPSVIEALGKEPEYNYFAQVITDYEAESGRDIPGIYRDSRGTLYHPHTGELIALGTLSAEGYRRPDWTFNKILYCEKEGFFPLMIDAKWPERHDCALMTSKGFASRAARDVLDLLGDTDEDLYFYAVHDADAYGTMIFQALQEGTRARGRRKVHIVNLGLEPAEAIEMNLQVENVTRKGQKETPVAGYVDDEWRKWLQTKRVELNAMTTPQFLQWLDRKFAGQVGKVVPPAEILVDRLRADVRTDLERQITASVLRKGRLDERVARALERREPAIRAQSETIEADVRRRLDKHSQAPWVEPITRLARVIVGRPPAL